MCRVLRTVSSCVSRLILCLLDTKVAIQILGEPFPPNIRYLKRPGEVLPAYGASTYFICLGNASRAMSVSLGVDNAQSDLNRSLT